MSTTLERDALYYPYIKVQSANWLKATLLCFPHVRRIVPGGYWPNDSEAIRLFTETEGIGCLPLLIDESPHGETIKAEQVRLAKKIRQNAGYLQQRFTKMVTLQKYPGTANHYRILHLKIDPTLRKTLLEFDLAWEDELGW